MQQRSTIHAKLATSPDGTPIGEDKRILLPALGVWVVAYSSKSDFMATHNGQRWKLQLYANGGRGSESIASDMLLPPVARVAATLQALRAGGAQGLAAPLAAHELPRVCQQHKD